MNSRSCLSLSLAFALTLARTAAADGVFWQVDIGADTRTLVAASRRGPWEYGLNISDYKGGRSGAINLAGVIALPGAVTLKAGPTLGWTRDDNGDGDTGLGARIALDRWSATSFGSTYVLAEASTPQRDWFLLAQVTLTAPAIGIELSRGGSETYHETTLALQRRVGEGPWSLRLGYKLDSEELFAGFSINTF